MKKYKKVVFVTMLTVFFCTYSFGQDRVDEGKVKSTANIKLAYLGSIVYPGIEVGAEYPLRLLSLTKVKRSGKEKLLQKDRFVSTSLGWYQHKNYQDIVYLQAEYVMRRQNSTGFYTEFLPGIGISRGFVGGTTYQVSDDGNVKVKKSKGYNYAMASLGAGLGYDFARHYTFPAAAYARLTVLTMFPYNSTINVRPTIEIGINAKLLTAQTRKYTKVRNRKK